MERPNKDNASNMCFNRLSIWISVLLPILSRLAKSLLDNQSTKGMADEDYGPRMDIRA